MHLCKGLSSRKKQLELKKCKVIRRNYMYSAIVDRKHSTNGKSYFYFWSIFHPLLLGNSICNNHSLKHWVVDARDSWPWEYSMGTDSIDFGCSCLCQSAIFKGIAINQKPMKSLHVKSLIPIFSPLHGWNIAYMA